MLLQIGRLNLISLKGLVPLVILKSVIGQWTLLPLEATKAQKFIKTQRIFLWMFLRVIRERHRRTDDAFQDGVSES